MELHIAVLDDELLQKFDFADVFITTISWKVSFVLERIQKF